VLVREIWRYPVKSVGGERLESAELGERGITGDRMWGIRDIETGLVLTGRREPALLFLSARLGDDDRPEIRCDDGSLLADDTALSTWLGRPAELVSALDGPGRFENPMNIDDETDWVEWDSAGITFHDGFSTVSLVTTGSLGDWNPRRFRANLLVDGTLDDERSLTGDVRVGAAVVSIRRPIDRCIMVTRGQPGIRRDLEVLTTIVRERDNKLAVGGTVATPARVSEGDPVLPLGLRRCASSGRCR